MSIIFNYIIVILLSKNTNRHVTSYCLIESVLMITGLLNKPSKYTEYAVPFQ